MSTFKPLYAGSTGAITITLASLTNGSYRQSAAVDNSTNLYLDALLTGKLKTGASGVSATGVANIYLYGWDGTEYSNNASGSDAAFTPDLQANLWQIATLQMTANATEYYLSPIQIAAAAGMLHLPQKWGLIVFNGTGATFDATAGNFLLEFLGSNTQGV